MPRVPVALGFRSMQGRLGQDGACRLVNAYAEEVGEEGKVKAAIYPIDGMTRLGTLTGTGGVRAMLALSEGTLLVVAGRTLHSVDAAGTGTVVGGIASDGPVTMARNRRATPQVAITVDGASWIYEGGLLTPLGDADLDSSNSVTSLDGYFVWTHPDGGFSISEVDGIGVSALDTATAESNPDGAVRATTRGRDLLLYGNQSLEFWQNVGSEFPFTRTTAIDVGAVSARSIATMDQTVAWVAHDGTVRILNGYVADIISTEEVQRLIENEPAASDITGWSWNARGHTFYGISGTNWTMVYDLKTKAWAERTSFGRDRYRIGSAVQWGDKAIFGDLDYGRIYRGSMNVFSEDGDSIIWTVQQPPITDFPYEARLDAVYADFVTGVGVNTGVDQDDDPAVMLAYSDDGGLNWSAERHMRIGRQGQTRHRVIARRLGRIPAQGRTLRWTASAKVARGLMDVQADIEPLR